MKITLIAFCAVVCAVAGCLCGAPSAAQSLTPLLGSLSKLAPPATPAATPAAPPAAPVNHAPVVLLGRTLFTVYSAGSRDAQDRADLASLRLADALRDLSANNEVQAPDVTVDQSGGSVVLRLGNEALLTVTQEDASANGDSQATVAAVWANAIHNALEKALAERRPAYLRWAAEQAALLLLAGVLVHLLIWIVARRWLGKPGWPVQMLLWICVIRLTLNLFPATRPVNNALWAGALRPLTLLLIVSLAAAVAARVWTTLIRRLFPPLPEHLSAEERTERTFSRRATLGGVMRVSGVTIIWIIGLIVALTWSGVNMSALLASAGLFGVAFSLSFQDSLKDLVAGINILADDRYGVGDTIAVGAYEGKVERLTLRITQIRDMSGRLVTLPNRNIAEVANETARWAQVDFKVGISYYDDLEKALETLEGVAARYAEENPTKALEPPSLLGADSFNDGSITLRLLQRTPPGDQWAVARDLRARVKQAFDAAGIAFMNSQYTVSTPAPARGPAEKPPKPASMDTSPMDTLPTNSPASAANPESS